MDTLLVGYIKKGLSSILYAMLSVISNGIQCCEADRNCNVINL